MFKKVSEDAILPTRGSKYSACVDVYANEDVIISAGETKLVGLGISIDLENSNVYKTSDYRWAEKKKPSIEVLESIKKQAIRDFKNSHYLQLNPRSSLRAKGLISNTGIIDLDYKDEIKMIIHNPIKMSNNQGIPDQYLLHPFKIKKGDRIGQITLLEHKSYLFGVDTEEERQGGFGSTNK